ncbi:hypothetical protein KSD_48810 [Ktedonobacter sp. SOSP1-85]|uniref:group I intron-associated PD-(D/E)XK endonuclease n=1 Tax=Ktedonobacter sp. SOSP1-85 TaxID=2778367 RepID=UPI00191569D7|nr:group I intron-associated PD-(D/E)XK endonuclease [Ktedonobacter sp. SOSP1-85]GHO77110.1 hypothetical protein KSD_48810 [Ktedonobacter sp. SOSP1-85]
MDLQGRDKRTTNSIGNISEAAIITRFLQLGYVVLIPNGRKQRYDLVIEDGEGQFWRVQCKTARIQDNGTVIAFDTANHNMALKVKRMRHYREQCDFFAVYCEELNKIYLLAVDQVGTTRANLRLVPAKNNQEKYVRWAKDYEM